MDDLRERMARLADLPAAELRAEWRLHFRTEPPSDFNRDLILRAIAHQMQKRSLGGLAAKHCKLLDRLAQGGGEPVRQLKVGTMMVREYHGVLHEAVVVPGGFHWQGCVHASLSTIARAITGTAWNGPRFFGLRGKRLPVAEADKVPAGGALGSIDRTPPRVARRSAVRPRQGDAASANAAPALPQRTAPGDRP
ncbi:MAG: DUF2924 domain-containing protein [Paracoccaceae bacterium]